LNKVKFPADAGFFVYRSILGRFFVSQNLKISVTPISFDCSKMTLKRFIFHANEPAN